MDLKDYFFSNLYLLDVNKNIAIPYKLSHSIHLLTSNIKTLIMCYLEQQCYHHNPEKIHLFASAEIFLLNKLGILKNSVSMIFKYIYKINSII